ncbi:MAG: LCP family protein [Christensenellales bacterium]
MLKSLRLILMALVLALPVPCPAGAEAGLALPAANPLVDREANRVKTYLAIPEGIVNILLLGIDSDAEGKDYTYRVEESHTDTMIVMAVNLAQRRVDLISIPRDTMAYVPGTRGVYKLNGAINVGATRAGQPARSPEGFQATCDTLSWVMGGLRLDHYLAIDMPAMAAIGDQMGGIDFDVVMNYGSETRRYKAGLQHLDGQGMVDYFRARTNATQDPGSDLARTGRQRALLTALLRKLMGSQRLLLSLISGTSSDPVIRGGFFTDLDLKDLPSLLGTALMLTAAGDGQQAVSVGSHVIRGTYRNAFGNWKFTFTDQEHRRDVIRAVYGVEVPPLQYVSYPYAKWLYLSGFKAIRHLSAAEGILAFLAARPEKLIGNQKAGAALEKMRVAYMETRDAFLLAANTLDERDTRLMSSAANRLRDAGNALAGLVAYPKKGGKVVWKMAKYHDDDRLVNEIYVNFR